MKNLIVTEEIWKEYNMYTSYCPELDIASCGHTTEEARKNLIEVIQIQLEETAKLGTIKEFLENAGYTITSTDSEIKSQKEIIEFKQIPIPIGII